MCDDEQRRGVFSSFFMLFPSLALHLKSRGVLKSRSSYALDDLDDVFVHEDVLLADPLRLVSDGGAPDPGVFEERHDALVDAVAELLDGGLFRVKDDGLVVVGDLAARLGVDAHHVALLPDLVGELVDVPVVARGDGAVVLHLVNNVQLFDRDGVDLVHDVQAGRVRALPVATVDEAVDRAVLAQDAVRADDAVLLHDARHDLAREPLRLRDELLESQTPLVLLPDRHVGRRLVEADPEVVQLALDQELVRHRLTRVQDDHDQVAPAHAALLVPPASTHTKIVLRVSLLLLLRSRSISRAFNRRCDAPIGAKERDIEERRDDSPSLTRCLDTLLRHPHQMPSVFFSGRNDSARSFFTNAADLRARGRDDLPSAALARGGALDDARPEKKTVLFPFFSPFFFWTRLFRQVEHLNARAACQSSENEKTVSLSAARAHNAHDLSSATLLIFARAEQLKRERRHR